MKHFKILGRLFVISLLLIQAGVYAQKIDIKDTRLLHQPAISDTHIAFIYAEDLWVANKNGTNPRRLTVDDGIESNPVFSPDGKTIGFNAEYEGNTDVYAVPVEGGIPQRLTWHPYTDGIRGFTPDGKSILFTSQRSVFTNRLAHLYTVPVTGGTATQLDIPNAYWATYSPDGKYIAYTPLSDRFNQWKHYRGGTISRIWIYDVATHEVTEIPKPAGGSNDSQPEWLGNKVYFRSDRDGEFNIYSYDMTTKVVVPLTDFKDFPVVDFSVSKDEIIFEQAGYLHTLSPATAASVRLRVGIATDLLELRPRYVSGSNYVRSGGISPSGARAVVDFRGDIVTVPAEKGDAINLTSTPGAHETFPAWSPDGKQIAYFSDASGEYALHVKNQNNREPAKAIKLQGSGFYAYLNWSPDSKKVVYSDNSRSIYVTDVTSGKTTKIAQDVLYRPGVYRDLFGSWSADSNFIAYTIVLETLFEQAFVYSLSENKSYPVSDGLSNVTAPTFDPSGKYLYMTASTDAGPVVNWFDQSNQDMISRNAIYLVTLQKDVRSPFAKENDIEEIVSSAEKKDEKKEETAAVTPLKIDWEGLQNRILDIPVPLGNYAELSVPKEGELYYLEFPSNYDGETMLHKYDLKTRKDEVLFETNSYEIAAKGEKMLYYSKGSWYISDTGKKSEKGALKTDAVQVKIDPPKEWENIFNEAWRVNRDYFYDPGMHGVDWNAMREKYKVFLPHLAAKSDLYRMMGWMFSELAVGHHRFGSEGDDLRDKKSIGGGLLGADYTLENNRYRISKIYGGLNWNPELRSPLTEPGVTINTADYLIKVDGEEITASDNLYRYFENKADKIVTLTVSADPTGKNAREEKVTPVSSEWALRNRDWVEGNIKKVDEATNGQVAYVYVPNTTTAGHEYFKRYFFPQATKKAIIIDERFNGGGQLADYVIDLLKKPEQSYWNFRYGNDMKAPSASIQGPKVMLIDETAGSGGDYMPYLFRKAELGTLIGKRTWGGLVGVLGYPEFIDGGSVTAPNVAFYTEDGFRIENEGVGPDVEVEQLPKHVIQGRDPQLEKAIEIVLKQLKENPPKKMETPPYPDKTKN